MPNPKVKPKVKPEDFNFFRNNMPLADIDEGTLWFNRPDFRNIFQIVDFDDYRVIGPGWNHVMTQIPDSEKNEILNNEEFKHLFYKL